MTKLVSSLALAAAAMLAACSSVTIAADGAKVLADVHALSADVTALAPAVCPEVQITLDVVGAALALVYPSGVPAEQTAAQVTKAVCLRLTTSASTATAAAPVAGN